jgi:uncharacterized iron-regulated membrane protein
MFDAKTERVLVYQNTEERRTGNVIELWLDKLHTAESLGWPYKVFVVLLGLVIAMLSSTGVYLWWVKRAARKRARRTEEASAVPVPWRTPFGSQVMSRFPGPAAGQPPFGWRRLASRSPGAQVMP